MKQIHFYVCEPFEDSRLVHSYQATKRLIDNRETDINTTQMGLLDFNLSKLGYRIFIHDTVVNSYELIIDSFAKKCGRKMQMIDIVDDLFLMWVSGMFNERSDG